MNDERYCKHLSRQGDHSHQIQRTKPLQATETGWWWWWWRLAPAGKPLPLKLETADITGMAIQTGQTLAGIAGIAGLGSRDKAQRPVF